MSDDEVWDDVPDDDFLLGLEVCPDCGKPEGSFACKIRHVQLNTGWAKSAND